jgi:hypothetical protein
MLTGSLVEGLQVTFIIFFCIYVFYFYNWGKITLFSSDKAVSMLPILRDKAEWTGPALVPSMHHSTYTY